MIQIPKETVAQNIMNKIKEQDVHIFSKWNAKDFIGKGKSLQFTINKDKVIITQVNKDNYNIKCGKEVNNNNKLEEVIPIINTWKGWGKKHE